MITDDPPLPSAPPPLPSDAETIPLTLARAGSFSLVDDSQTALCRDLEQRLSAITTDDAATKAQMIALLLRDIPLHDLGAHLLAEQPK